MGVATAVLLLHRPYCARYLSDLLLQRVDLVLQLALAQMLGPAGRAPPLHPKKLTNGRRLWLASQKSWVGHYLRQKMARIRNKASAGLPILQNRRYLSVLNFARRV